jgi:GDP-4-dehydro-6-deoxy-D-mannose reductase
MQTKRLLITGSSGFVGQWCLRSPAPPPGWEMVETGASLDLRDASSIDAELAGRAPDAVLHLAAQSFVPASFDDPRATLEINLLGTLNLLQALRRAGFSGRFVYVSSADVYGQVPPERMPIDEARCPEPRNPYAVSKFAAEALCRQWHHSHGLDVVVARPFNHIGPGQDPRFVVSGLAREFALIGLGRQDARITVGDLDVSRDFTDVRDVVRAYFGLLEGGAPGAVYNVCSGGATRLREVVALLREITGLDPEIVVDPARLRPNEQKLAFGSARAIAEAIGWAPSIALRRSLQDTHSFWLREIANGQD